MPFWIVTRYTLQEVTRKRLLLAVVILTIAFIAIYGIGSHLLAGEIARGSARGANPVLPFIAGLMTVMAFYIVSFLGGLLAVFVSIGALSGELETGTILALAARPVRRWEIVAGKWLALAMLIGGYLAVVSAGVLVIGQLTTGYFPPEPGPAIALILCQALVLLSLAILGSTIFSTLTNGAVTFMLFGVAWVGGLVESFGTIFDNQSMINAGIVSSLIVPSDALWRGASFHLQPVALIAAQNMSPAANPFTSATPIAAPMVVYSVMYLAACLILAVRRFGSRDL